MPGRFKAVLFDWDGTLVDSAETSYRCYQQLFGRFGIAFDRRRFEETYSPNWHRTYSAIGLAEGLWSEADRLWLEFYARERTRLLPGVGNVLDRLAAAGLTQGLVTSGDRRRVEREIATLQVEGYFAAVVCGDDARQRKPHPEALLLALERIAIAPRDAAYVGDSPEDIEMARAAGAFSIGIPGGFPNQKALRASNPDVLLDAIEDAVAALTT